MSTSLRLSWSAALLLLLGACDSGVTTLATGPASTLPSTEFPSPTLRYSSFHSLATGEDLATALKSSPRIFLPAFGDYTIANPIVIDQPGAAVYIHGINRLKTRLVPQNPSAPLFIVKNAALVNFSNMQFVSPQTAVNYQPIAFQNTNAMEIEMQDVLFRHMRFVADGPGTYRFQGSYFANCGNHDSAVYVNHPDADVVIVAGNSQGECLPTGQVSEYHHVWQKRGRLRVYGLEIQNNLGLGDFKLETPGKSAHHISFVRSEGRIGKSNTQAEEMLVVPPTDAAVDVVFVANSMGDEESYPDMLKINAVADYNANGKLYLASNSASLGAYTLVKGTAPRSTVVAVANYILGKTPLAIQAGTLLYAANAYYYCWLNGCLNSSTDLPYLRAVTDTNGLATNITVANQAAAAIPSLEIPQPLDHPLMDVQLPGFASVRSYGALGDGNHDDTSAIQSAIAANQAVYFPPGTYRTTDVIDGTQTTPGGFYAGAGPELTKIRRDFAQLGSVFTTTSLAYATVQGITFQTAPFVPGETTPMAASNFTIEWNGSNLASQEVMVYQCVFDGGSLAAGSGITTGQMGDGMLFVNDVFKNASRGFTSGSYNALNNIVYNGVFDNTDIPIGNGAASGSGGTFGWFLGKARNTRYETIEYVNSVDNTGLFYGITSDAPYLLMHGFTSARFGIYIDQSQLDSGLVTDAQSVNAVWSNAATNIVLNRSSLRGRIVMAPGASANTFIKMNSQVDRWAQSLYYGANPLSQSSVITIDSGANPYNLKDGLAGFWKLGDATGSSVALDSSGLGRSGIPTNSGIHFGASGPASGKAASFDGVGGISIANQDDFNSKEVSVSLWFYAAPGSSGCLFCKGSHSTNGFTLTYGGGLLSLAENGNTPTGNVPVAANQWHHIVAIHRDYSPTREIYIDGTLKYITGGPQGQGTTIFPTSTNFMIGGANDYGYVAGSFAQVGYWTRPLDQREIELLAKGWSP